MQIRDSCSRLMTLLVYPFICFEEDGMHWPEEDMENLRVALSALARVCRM